MSHIVFFCFFYSSSHEFEVKYVLMIMYHKHLLVFCSQCKSRGHISVKTDGVPVCHHVPLCVSTVKKAKLDGPQGKI